MSGGLDLFEMALLTGVAGVSCVVLGVAVVIHETRRRRERNQQRRIGR